MFFPTIKSSILAYIISDVEKREGEIVNLIEKTFNEVSEVEIHEQLKILYIPLMIELIKKDCSWEDFIMIVKNLISVGGGKETHPYLEDKLFSILFYIYQVFSDKIKKTQHLLVGGLRELTK